MSVLALSALPMRVRACTQSTVVGVFLLLVLSGIRLWPELCSFFSLDVSALDMHITQLLFFNLRLPRVLAAVVAGAALGLSGALFQALTRNPLAAPDLLGVTGSAQLGIFAAIIFPVLGGVARVPFLFACGMLGALLAIFAAGGWQASALRLILAGMACSLLFSAFSLMLMTIFEEDIASVALWSNGLLYQPDAHGLLTVMAWFCFPLLLLPWIIKPLEISALGDNTARALGVALRPLRLMTLLITTLFAAGATAVAGPMGFIGLIAPNLLRTLGVQRLSRLLPLAAIWGAVILLAADSLVMRLQLEATLSTGVMIVMVGTPVLLFLIHRHRVLTGMNSTTHNWFRFQLPFKYTVLVCSVLLLLLIVFAALYGETWLTPHQWFDNRLVLELRLARVLTALLAGALLAASGVLLQSVVRNPLAGPEVLGIVQGSGLAILLMMVTTSMLSRGMLLFTSFFGGTMTLGLILILNRRHHLAPLPIALTGIALGALYAALSQWLVVENSVEQARFLVWLVGGTYGRSLVDALYLLPWFLCALPILYWLARPLDMLVLGEQYAATLGIPVIRVRMLALALATVLACAVVAVIGPVSFVGLMTPHLAQMLGFHRHRQRLPIAMLLGALVLGLADVAGRTVLAPIEIPAGAMTALIGAPYLIAMLVLGQRKRRLV